LHKLCGEEVVEGGVEEVRAEHGGVCAADHPTGVGFLERRSAWPMLWILGTHSISEPLLSYGQLGRIVVRRGVGRKEENEQRLNKG